MSTTTTEALTTQLRSRLLNFAPLAGATLTARLGGRFWKDAAPDTAAYPFGVMRMINRIALNMREEFDLEVMLYGRPRDQADDIEHAADVCDQAMLNYKDSSSGVTFSHERRRDTLLPPVDPADREVVQVRLVYNLKVWPVLLSQYT